MKKILLLAAILFPGILASAQDVKFQINDGLSDALLRKKIESNITRLLQACNSAFAENQALKLADISISDDASQSVTQLWRHMPFCCRENLVVEMILQTYDDGYQVRNIPIEVKDDKGKTDYQELVIGMDGEGMISRIKLALKRNLYRKVFSDKNEVTDLRHREEILKYVEDFRTAYNKKDIDFLETVFSDDALIITGKVVYRKQGDHTAVLKTDRQVEYKVQNKKEYLNRLRKVFQRASYIRVDFSDIDIYKHPSIDGYYGVRLVQGYESSEYSDKGYLFMLWDFRDENKPQIHVRTWQPYWMDDARTIQFDESKVFGINDFRIQ